MICSVPGCSQPSCKRSFCNAHYIRLRRYGDPLAGAPRPTVEQRFWAKVDKSGDCWVWTAKATSHGAGWFKPGGRGINPLYAYRFSYELLVGPVPDGMELDHQCHNRLCVRPDHLRPVSHKQNLENRSGPARHSRSGVRGVRRVPSGRWSAAVKHHGEALYLGTFDTMEEAEDVVIAKRNELFTHNDLDRGQQ